MFERYTEEARRVIFFARYEASQYGSTAIETEHLLLGVLREDRPMVNRFLPPAASFQAIKQRIGAPRAEKVSTSVDLPLSVESKHVLTHGAEEADRLGHREIGTEHLLLGLMNEEGSLAAAILKEYGLDLTQMRLDLAQTPPKPARPRRDNVRPSFYVSESLRLVIREELARCLHGPPATETPYEPEELVSVISVSRAVLRKMIQEEVSRNAPERADASSAADPESPPAG